MTAPWPLDHEGEEERAARGLSAHSETGCRCTCSLCRSLDLVTRLRAQAVQQAAALALANGLLEGLRAQNARLAGALREALPVHDLKCDEYYEQHTDTCQLRATKFSAALDGLPDAQATDRLTPEGK